MTKYVAHKLSLQHKLQSKCNKKDPASAPVVAANATDVAADAAVTEPFMFPVLTSVTSVCPVPVDDSLQMSGVKGEFLCQVKLFDSFAQSLEASFTSVDNRFSQVMSDSASKVDVISGSNNVSQLGIVLNFNKSSLTPTQTATYLGTVIVSPSEGFSFPGEGFDPALADHRISVLQAAKCCCLLGHLSSLCHLVPGGCLRMWSSQLVL